MNIVITGSSGFVGTSLIDFLLGKGHQVTAVDAVPLPGNRNSDALTVITADTTKQGEWQESIRSADAVVNLTGKNIFHRWSKKYKDLIYDSRILTTRNIVEALPEGKQITFISTSAAGYYGNRGDETLDEDKPSGDDFLARVCIDWEKEALAAREKGARVVLTRFGVVLGAGGGALSKMIPAYRMFVGGPLGDGRQWFPWIHIDDLVRGVGFLINDSGTEGAVNLCSPNPVRNSDFSKTLGAVLNRPAFFRIPAFVLKLAAGELGSLVLNSQRAVPARLVSAGFSFKYPKLRDALTASIT